MMKSRWLVVLVMGTISLALMSTLDLLVAKQTLAGVPSLWVSWFVSLALTGLVAWRAASRRMAWGVLSLINGGISCVILLAMAVLPVSASAPYEPGSDWLRSVDLTPPVVAQLREAIASAYFAIGVIIAGVIFLGAGYLLLHHGGNASRHAH